LYQFNLLFGGSAIPLDLIVCRISSSGQQDEIENITVL